MPEEEKKKRDDEKEAKAKLEFDESQIVAKRKGVRIFVCGQNFVKTDVSILNNY